MILGKHPAMSALLIVATVTTIVYSNSLTNAFTFDDHPIVEYNHVLRGNLQEVVISPFWPDQPGLGLYRPFTLLSFAANYRVFGTDPLSYRVVSILLHVLASWFLYLNVTRLCGQKSGLVSAIMFAVHPIQSEAVNAIVGRAEILAGMFVLLAWYTSHRAEDDGVKWRVFSLLAYLLACFSKEHALVLPAFLIVENLLLNQEGTVRKRISGSFGRWRIWLQYVILGAGVLVIRILLVGSLTLPNLPDYIDNPLAHVDPFTRILTAVGIFSRYIALLLFPVNLTVDYTFNQIPLVTSLFDLHFLVGFVFLAALTTIAYRAANDGVNALIGLGGLLILLAWFPVSNVPFAIGTPMNERLMYLSMIGFCVFVGIGYGRLSEVGGGCPSWVAGLVLCLLFGVRTSIRNADWQNDFTLFSAAALSSPNSAKAAFNLGNAYRDEENYKAALGGYSRALAIYPAYAEVHYNVGVVYQHQQKFKEAVAAYREATTHNPNHVGALLNKGILLARSGNIDGAILHFEHAISVSPDRSDAHYNLGLAMERKSNRSASAAYREALRVEPGNENAAVNLAMVYRRMGRRGEMMSTYRDVLEVNPRAYRVAYNLASELERSGVVEEAIDVYRIAWQATGELGAFSRSRMGMLFAKTGKHDSARVALGEFKEVWTGDIRHAQNADRLLERLR